MDVEPLSTEGSIAKLLSWRASATGDSDFLYVEDEGPWTYGTVADEAARLHETLVTVGVQQRDLVIVRVGNDQRFPAAAFAVWMAGGGVIAVHPSAPARDLVDIAASMQPRAIVADPQDPAARAAGLPIVAAHPFSPGDSDGKHSRAKHFDVPQSVHGSETALVLLTSGSTGKPKGVSLSHDNAWANLRATVSAFRSDTSPSRAPSSRKPPNLIANPLSHTAGVVRLLFALYVGRRVVLLRKFSGLKTKRLVDRHGIDNLTINPAMLRMLIDEVPAGEVLGTVRYVSSGTAPLPAALREEFESRFNVPVLQAYGQTEAFGGIAIESAKDVLAGRRRPGSVGRPLPGVELRIVGEDGNDSPRDEAGELLVRTRSATGGYLGNDAQSPVDGDGWLRTGDQGRLDEDGYLYITGRTKNIIICGGFNIVPEEIEAALAQDESVRDATVVGVPDARLGEIPVALVESSAAADLVMGRAAAHLAPYKRPRRVFRVEGLPRVANGKVDRPAATRLARTLCDVPEAQT